MVGRFQRTYLFRHFINSRWAVASAANAMEKQRPWIGFLSGELADCGREPHYLEGGGGGGVIGCSLFIWSREDLWLNYCPNCPRVYCNQATRDSAAPLGRGVKSTGAEPGRTARMCQHTSQPNVPTTTLLTLGQWHQLKKKKEKENIFSDSFMVKTWLWWFIICLSHQESF